MTTSWQLDTSKILQKDDISRVLADLRRKSRRFQTSRANLTLFCLATFAGLRASEAADLTVGDVGNETPEGTLPIRVRDGKGGRGRMAHVYHADAVAILLAWRGRRLDAGAKLTDPFVATCHAKRLTRQTVRSRFRTACKVLGRDVTTHDGRHTYVSLSLAAGVPLAEVQASVGHASAATTAIYIHCMTRTPARDCLV